MTAEELVGWYGCAEGCIGTDSRVFDPFLPNQSCFVGGREIENKSKVVCGQLLVLIYRRVSNLRKKTFPNLEIEVSTHHTPSILEKFDRFSSSHT